MAHRACWLAKAVRLDGKTRFWTARRSAEVRPDYFRIAGNPGVISPPPPLAFVKQMFRVRHDHAGAVIR
jgi:hypothetical protein